MTYTQTIHDIYMIYTWIMHKRRKGLNRRATRSGRKSGGMVAGARRSPHGEPINANSPFWCYIYKCRFSGGGRRTMGGGGLSNVRFPRHPQSFSNNLPHIYRITITLFFFID